MGASTSTPLPAPSDTVARRKFDEAAALQDTHPYAALAREVAAETGVFLVDMDAISRNRIEALGVENSKALFLHLAPCEFDNYPKGRTDDTHLSVAGAREVAELRKRGHHLAAYAAVKKP